MKKVMLIGDSIRLGYQPKVTGLLGDAATVTGPADNCRFSSYTLFQLAAWAPDSDYDVIQWNNGQWDTCYMLDGKIHTPLDQYLQLQQRIASILMKKTRRLIFATTTPVWPEQFTTAKNNPRRNEDINAYNQAAANLLGKSGIEINDLNSPIAAEIKRYISADMVHLTDEGYTLCAERIAALISG
jgi:hypothetical protein